MRIPTWKKYLSYIFEQHIETIAGELNSSLHVTCINGRLQLSTDSAVYSFDDLYDNFYSAFEQIDWNKWQPKETLILGLGLGSVPYMLENNFGVSTHYTAIELDEAVIYLAEKYRLHELQAPIQCVATDAAVFVKLCSTQFDLIIIDVFVDDQIPASILDANFMESIAKLLTDKGLVLFNHMAMDAVQKEQAKSFLETVMQPIFPQASIIQTRNNFILTNHKYAFK